MLKKNQRRTNFRTQLKRVSISDCNISVIVLQSSCVKNREISNNGIQRKGNALLSPARPHDCLNYASA